MLLFVPIVLRKVSVSHLQCMATSIQICGYHIFVQYIWIREQIFWTLPFLTANIYRNFIKLQLLYVMVGMFRSNKTMFLFQLIFYEAKPFQPTDAFQVYNSDDVNKFRRSFIWLVNLLIRKMSDASIVIALCANCFELVHSWHWNVFALLLIIPTIYCRHLNCLLIYFTHVQFLDSVETLWNTVKYK